MQSAPRLGAPSLWQPLPSVVTVSGTNYSVSVSTTNAAQFFRLRKP